MELKLRNVFSQSGLVIMMLIFMMGCCGTTHLISYIHKDKRYIASQENVDHLMNSTVAIMGTEKDEITGESKQYLKCTGFFISSDVLVSARHCFGENKTKTVQELEEIKKIIMEQDIFITNYRSFASAGTEAKVSIARMIYFPTSLPKKGLRFDENDFAVLKLNPTERKSEHWLLRARKNSKIGEKIYSVSFPEGAPWILTEGLISQYYYDWNKFPRVSALLVSVSIVDHGSSGSAIVDNQGRLVGILSTTTESKQYGQYVPVEVLNIVLDKMVP